MPVLGKPIDAFLDPSALEIPATTFDVLLGHGLGIAVPTEVTGFH